MWFVYLFFFDVSSILGSSTHSLKILEKIYDDQQFIRTDRGLAK